MERFLYWLLLLVPITLFVHFVFPQHQTVVFLLSAGCMVPLANLLSESTEQLAARTGPTLGALLNVTFGNAGELVIGFFALREGLQDVVKASITGSLLVNLLLTLGLSMIMAGRKEKTLRFNALSARNQATMLLLAAISLVLPAAYALLGGPRAVAKEGELSLAFAVVLICTYALSLVFTLKTHTKLLVTEKAERSDHAGGWSTGKAFGLLFVSAVFVGVMGEILVGSVEFAAKSWGLTDLFIGLVVVALAGNAAEATSAVKAALAGRMDLSVGIGIGSSLQIALFVAPGLILLSYFVGRQPMNLVFSLAELVAILLTTLIAGQVASDGESNWFEGVQLVAVYLMLAVMFYDLPAIPAASNAH
jgi:Ca2+:H+ antiporter